MCAATDPSGGLLSSSSLQQQQHQHQHLLHQQQQQGPPTDRRAVQTSCGGVLRSPSRDSVATDLSLLSLSSLGSGMSKTPTAPLVVKTNYRVSNSSAPGVDNGNADRKSWNGGGDIEEELLEDEDRGEEEEEEQEEEDDPRTARGQSPNPDSCAATGSVRSSSARGSRNNLQVPCEHYGFLGRNKVTAGVTSSLSETLFEEESDLIRSCGALSSVLGLRRSFSTSDISQGSAAAAGAAGGTDSMDPILKQSASEMVLTAGGGVCGREAAGQGRLDYSSRSCSTWVAVGDMASTSQLPSPQGSHPPAGGGQVGEAPAITAAEFVRSVNKKVRQTYIKRRLLTTYKALERIAQSELNLQAACGRCCGGDPLAMTAAGCCKVSKTQVSREILKLLRKDFDPHGPGLLGAAVKSLSLTVKDVEREKGKPLTKYERNMMIFNWLHTLEDTTFDRLA